MKTRLLIITGSIVAIIVIGSVVISLTYGQDVWKEQVGGLEQTGMIDDDVLIRYTTEFLFMDCEYLTHMFPEFPSVEVADALNTRMHECINEQKSLLLQTELEKWNEISCLEILNNPEMEFEDNVDKRAFDIRWKQCLENEN